MSFLLSKRTYRQVVKKLEHYKAQDQQDRQENPHAIPIDWAPSLTTMIEATLRENHERCPRELPRQVLEYLADKGMLVPYCGGFAFPGKDLPTEEEIVDLVEKNLSLNVRKED